MDPRRPGKMQNLKIVKELLPGVFVFESEAFGDERGFLHAPFHAETFFQCVGHKFEVDQTMISRSRLGVLRGLHYQDNTAPVAKLISCIRGEVYDVIVDLRVKSETFGQWAGIYLSFDLHVYAPVGTAHGFVSLYDNTEVFYHQMGDYTPNASCILSWDDPDLGISWPSAHGFTMSDRDRTEGISLEAYKNNPQF